MRAFVRWAVDRGRPRPSRVRLGGAPNDLGLRVDVQVDDQVTDKTVSKLIRIGGVPEEDRSLTVAIAVEELLRASWMELAMAERREDKRNAPPAVVLQVEAEVRSSIEPESPTAPSHAIDLFADASFLIGGVGLVGGGARYTLWPHERLGVTAQMRVLRLLPTRLPSGDVAGSAILPSIAMAISLLERPALVGLELRAYGTMGWLGLEPTSRSPAITPLPSSHLVVMAGGEPTLSFHFTSALHGLVAARVGGVLQGVQFQDQLDATSSSFVDVELGGSLGLRVLLE